ncbi:hypothetical protein TELCIR_05818 [Teladorsagia circumcincta]|uniref:SXP/RAL-2 family protein Ani s 5-like cation-binding domain-containing protein n=1 Tax=Teladorsagia circumcincta TaxID=45464 RepID=A0A2G9UPR3_TELCI|nr:hypothetical protein TELCIR_05818 [Teladorsagia circumcincta]
MTGENIPPNGCNWQRPAKLKLNEKSTETITSIFASYKRGSDAHLYELHHSALWHMLAWLSWIAFIALAAAQSRTRIPCGLPPFVTKLPTKQAEQLREAWANYQNGTSCVNEQKRTFEIVASLTEAERAAVFEFRVEPVAVDDHFDTTPRFIKMLSPEVKEGFDAIWMNSTTPDAEKHKRLREYAEKKFNAEQKEGFEEWLAEIIKAKKAMDERISKLSAKSQQIREEERKLMQSMTPEVSKELAGLI